MQPDAAVPFRVISLDQGIEKGLRKDWYEVDSEVPDGRIHRMLWTWSIEVDIIRHPWIIPAMLSRCRLNILGDCRPLVLVRRNLG